MEHLQENLESGPQVSCFSESKFHGVEHFWVGGGAGEGWTEVVFSGSRCGKAHKTSRAFE